jgi:hypothetical protein
MATLPSFRSDVTRKTRREKRQHILLFTFRLVMWARWHGPLPRLPRAQPDLLARHCTEAGLIDKAAGLWGKAGLLSLERAG